MFSAFEGHDMHYKLASEVKELEYAGWWLYDNIVLMSPSLKGKRFLV